MSVSMNAYANGANQNCGNVMTGRSSTRIHAPPGGGSTFSLGWGSEDTTSMPVKENVRRRDPNQSSLSIGGSDAKAPAKIVAPQQQQAFGAVANAQSSNRYANGANQNCGNVLTDRPSTRVVAPPGGISQITFG